MTPISFECSNSLLKGEKRLTDLFGATKLNLPIYRGHGLAISCWRPTLWERLKILFTGRVWLISLSATHPPVKLTTEHPFQSRTSE